MSISGDTCVHGSPLVGGKNGDVLAFTLILPGLKSIVVLVDAGGVDVNDSQAFGKAVDQLQGRLLPLDSVAAEVVESILVPSHPEAPPEQSRHRRPPRAPP